MNSSRKALLLAGFLSLFASMLAFLVQNNGERSVNRCSYLDPLLIDIFAFMAAVFLVIEGIYTIVMHQKDTLKWQILACIRIAIGFAIITLHIMQVVHK